MLTNTWLMSDLMFFVLFQARIQCSMDWWEFHQPNRDVDLKLFIIFARHKRGFLGSIVVSIPACHAGDRGSIPRRGESFFFFLFVSFSFSPLNVYSWKIGQDIYTLQYIRRPRLCSEVPATTSICWTFQIELTNSCTQLFNDLNLKIKFSCLYY